MVKEESAFIRAARVVAKYRAIAYEDVKLTTPLGMDYKKIASELKISDFGLNTQTHFVSVLARLVIPQTNKNKKPKKK